MNVRTGGGWDVIALAKVCRVGEVGLILLEATLEERKCGAHGLNGLMSPEYAHRVSTIEFLISSTQSRLIPGS